MGLGGIGPGSLLVILVIALVVFGTKRLRNVGSDLGVAVKSFRKGLEESGDANNDNSSDSIK